jgi:hypothetical protein
MKHLKLFEEHLNELNYGDKLFADPAYSQGDAKHLMAYSDLIKKAYNGETEKDTPEERKLWMRIKNYLKHNQKHIAKNKKDLKTLLKLKKDFPVMLDPEDSGPIGQVYRGMTSEPKDVVKWIKAASNVYKDGILNRWIILDGIKDTIKSRNDNGFISVSSQLDMAQSLGMMNKKDDRWTIVARAEYKQVAKNSIISPDFAEVMSGYAEGEVWILGNSLPVNGILIQNPEQYGRFNYKGGEHEMEKSSVAIKEALEERGLEMNIRGSGPIRNH